MNQFIKKVVVGFRQQYLNLAKHIIFNPKLLLSKSKLNLNLIKEKQGYKQNVDNC